MILITHDLASWPDSGPDMCHVCRKLVETGDRPGLLRTEMPYTLGPREPPASMPLAPTGSRDLGTPPSL